MTHPDDAATLAAVADIRAALDRLDAILPAAFDAQWSAAPVAKPRDDTTERSKGGHGDPTPAIALDERRLALREAVSAVNWTVGRVAVVLSATATRLDGALTDWEKDA